MVFRRGDVGPLYPFERRTMLSRPQFGVRPSCGFPSPAEDWIERSLDLNEHLVRHPVATFFSYVTGDSMYPKIHPNDLIIVDRAAETCDGAVVVAILGGEFLVRRLRIEAERLWLEAANENYPPIEVTEEVEFCVWGKVIHSVHSH